MRPRILNYSTASAGSEEVRFDKAAVSAAAVKMAEADANIKEAELGD